MGICATSMIEGEGLSGVVLAGLKRVGEWFSLKKEEKKADRQPYGRFFVRAGRVERSKGREQKEEGGCQAEKQVVRVVTEKRQGWARRRQERVKDKLGEGAYQSLEGIIRWCWGEKAETVAAEMSMQRSGFYYRLEQVLERLPEVFVDRRRDNGRPARGLEKEMIGQIVEVVVGQPGLSAEGVSQKIAEQSGSRVREREVAEYLRQAQLWGYQGSGYRAKSLPVVKEVEQRFSRYAAHLLQVPVLEQMGFYQVVGLLDITTKQTYYGHLLRCHTVMMALSSGKTRLYHTGELVADEFGRMLGERRYPQSSDLHSYFDRIVEQDQAQAEQGIPTQERLVEQFVRQGQRVLAQAAEPGAGQAIYVDPHIIALYTDKRVPRTKHGVQKRVVKALVKLGVVSAKQPGRLLAFELGQGDLCFRSNLEKIVDLTSWTTGEAVEVVGIDRGGLSQNILERFEERGIGLLVWSKNTSTMQRELAAVEKDVFQEAEYEIVRQTEKGEVVQRLKTRAADVPAMVINAEGYRCRTIVVEDVAGKRRIGIHAVGQPTRQMNARQILTFMRGKQWVEENFKQDIAWGSDHFCGGKIDLTLRRERPSVQEVAQLKDQAGQLKARWRTNLAEEGQAVTRWCDRQCTKRQLNDLLKGIRRRRKQIETDWRSTEELIKWGLTGLVPKNQQQWVVDIRKMQLMSQFQTFARLTRQETMHLVRQFLKQALVENLMTKQEGYLEIEQQQAIAQQAELALARLPWGQFETRLFEQGGWVHKDTHQRVMYVTLKPFKHQLLQRACELLCLHLNQQQALMRCQDGDYSLQYACRASPLP